jgi:DNA-binding PadR family transcriptional regulator
VAGPGFVGWGGLADVRSIALLSQLAYVAGLSILVAMTERALQEPTVLLLTALADAPKHGYALMQEVEAISGGRVRLRTGTLYGALDRLLQQGLIAVDSEEVVEGRNRRAYALSEAGREVLAAEAERLRATADEARRRLEAGRARVPGGGRERIQGAGRALGQGAEGGHVQAAGT